MELVELGVDDPIDALWDISALQTMQRQAHRTSEAFSARRRQICVQAAPNWAMALVAPGIAGVRSGLRRPCWRGCPALGPAVKEAR